MQLTDMRLSGIHCIYEYFNIKCMQGISIWQLLNQVKNILFSGLCVKQYHSIIDPLSPPHVLNQYLLDDNALSISLEF